MTTTPAPQQEPTHRVEWFGSLQVYQPITQPTPDAHTLRRELSVACA